METNLSKYLRARRPIIWVHSGDYKEVDTIVTEATKEYKNKAIFEYRAFGAVNFETKVKSDEVADLYSFLNILFSVGFKTNVFLLIKNTEEEMKEARNIAFIKKIAEKMYNDINYNFNIIIVDEDVNVPKGLEKFTSIIDIETMDETTINQYIQDFAQKNNARIYWDDLGDLSISLKGLTKLDLDHILNMILEENYGAISKGANQIIIREKGQIIKKSSILEIIDFKEKIEEIGGLEGLKEWLSSKAQVFRRLDEAKKFGVDTPKGVLLVGMPGCGKSLAAKASARLFNVPLLRLDIGRLLGKYVGESEHNMRIALKTAESISPCILWIDEIEKAFAGIDQNGGASDITKRLFGQFLTWLQEKENTVFVVATANDITAFPPEFLRKGRFDEVFFIDFPNEEERERIFEIHLEKRGKMSDDINLKELAEETEGYCGADIEEIVKNAVENKFILETENKEEKKITTNNLLEATKSIDSLSNILSDKIDVLKKSYKKFKIKSASQKIKNGKKIGGRRPVENVSWWDALEFCNKLSKKYGLKPVYDLSRKEEGILRIHQSNGKIEYPNVADFRKTEGFRLPTEVEWEWFARGGEVAMQDGTFNYDYSGSDNLNEVAWHYDNSGKETHDVGTKKPNQLGLYDCSGNVWEWCYDTANYGYIPEKTPYIYDEVCLKKRMKGNSWYSSPNTCELRPVNSEDSNGRDFGFRIVRTI
ncbi:ATP-dependent 26S proteasome regulatory subunit [Leptotrichia trevisanii]|uniref:Uncharacterized AAA domain-containing protein ycf46 n=1 Tax=Leptotrichia trevisanii TaxID=109328 RepID=A0A510KKM8_9FUSO|nr:SUMF1/EgtB/PvdO family nonheme iron enzyme [Leptotrichia trevisanii]BBM52232.1 ATP-dependent 26S proteasome regulatory subunit [Leptotrichia trevisanii]